MDPRVFRRYLATMAWEEAGVDSFGNLSYLLQPHYTENMRALLARAQDVSGSLLRADLQPQEVHASVFTRHLQLS